MLIHLSNGHVRLRSLRWLVMVATTMLGAAKIDVSANAATNAAPPPAETSRLKNRTDRVIVFKDGYCLIIKQAVATTDADGNVFTDEVPDAAVLGSFWTVPEKGTIKSTVAAWVNTETKANRDMNCTSIIEIVKSNLGKDCSFAVGEQRVEGKLLKVLSSDDMAKDDTTVWHDASLSGSFVSSASTPAPQMAITTVSVLTGNYFLVQTTTGDKMILASTVSDLTIKEMNSMIEQTVTTKSRHKRLTMKFSEANTEIKLNLMYFRPDVRWIPTYRLNLTGKVLADKKNTSKADERKKAELIMQGEILNEAEDLINVPFHVVVGVPNFRFRSVSSPMVLEATMRNVLSQAAPDVMGNGNYTLSNTFFSQRAGEFPNNRVTGNETRSDVSLPDELVGKGGNDLFVYELPIMTLKRGERAMVPILRSEVAYRDVYTWNIELTHSESYAASAAAAPSPLVLSENKVWRQIELVNSTNIPWTTGAAMLVDNQQPLAQELLTYTSPGGMCRVPVTIAVDMRGKVTDSEVNRVFNVLKWRGNDFARVEGMIDVELTNNKKDPVSVEVQLRFGGKATKVTDDGTITLESFRLQDWRENRGNPINNSSLVRWETTLAPGASFKPDVNYEYMLQY
jgi:hypothetical protein